MPDRSANENIIEIRRATTADAAALSDLARRTFSETFAADNDAGDLAAYMEATYSPAIQARELDDPSRPCLVVTRDATLVAYASCRATPDAELPAGVTSRPSLEIQRFYLVRGLQGSGVAQALMGECLHLARARGAAAVHLGVWERNARALRFYAAQGFVEVGEQPFVLGTDVQRDLVLVRRLDDAPTK